MVAPFGDAPQAVVQAPDGTSIAVFAGGGWGADGAAEETPILLVHGTGSDHTTWRSVAPLLAGHRVYALDRRGRGASGDREPYAVGREVEDVAAVADAIAAAGGRGVAVVGHSLGGRLALAASLRSGAIERVVGYEGAPTPPDPGGADERLLAGLAADLRAGDHDAVLERFLREAAGLPEDQLAAFRASELWAMRARTAPQIVRELDAALHDPDIGMEALARVGVPVLQLAGTESAARFRDGVVALDRRITHGRVEFVAGARHNAHHSHAEAFAVAVIGYLAP
jgi:pimeloyl-ACP methyl ester carboxylesterase